jgi:hypothetical protein
MPSRRYDLSRSMGIVPGEATRLPGIEKPHSEADTLMYQK